MPEEIRLSTTFWAVPAFIRVEPAISSRPVSINTGHLADVSRGTPALLARPIVTAPDASARCSAATVSSWHRCSLLFPRGPIIRFQWQLIERRLVPIFLILRAWNGDIVAVIVDLHRTVASTEHSNCHIHLPSRLGAKSAQPAVKGKLGETSNWSVDRAGHFERRAG